MTRCDHLLHRIRNDFGQRHKRDACASNGFNSNRVDQKHHLFHRTLIRPTSMPVSTHYQKCVVRNTPTECTAISRRRLMAGRSVIEPDSALAWWRHMSWRYANTASFFVVTIIMTLRRFHLFWRWIPNNNRLRLYHNSTRNHTSGQAKSCK